MKDYCTQNNGNCETCSLVNYSRDCQNNPLSNTEIQETWFKLGKAIRKAEKDSKAKPYSILNNFMHNVGQCHEQWGNAGKMLNGRIAAYRLNFGFVYEDDIKTNVDWNKIIQGYMQEG